MIYDFIDLGCGVGGSIEWIQNRFGVKSHLGIDNRPNDVQKAIDNGYNVILGDINNDNMFPKSKFITMLHFLEHLKNETYVENVIKKSINSATDFIFIKGPSFEDVEYLKQFNYKITWTDWVGHYTMVTKNMLENIINKSGLEYKIGFQYPILNSNSNEIIPISSPTDTIIYDNSLGIKKYTELKNVYREIFCFININCPNWEEIINTKII